MDGREANDLEAVPATLRALDQWLAWRQEPPAKAGAKPRKVPYIAGGGGQKASSTDPATWRPFAVALRAWLDDPTVAGVGFVFRAGGGLVGLDMDDSLDPDGQLVPWAEPVFAQVGAALTYGEVSPSGSGVKVILAGELPHDPATGEAAKGRNRRRGTKAKPLPGGIELYPDGRYFTITGRRYPGCSAEVTAGDPAGLARLYARMKPPRPAAVPRAYVPGSADDGGGDRLEWCWRFLLRCPASISGANGHDKALRAACEAVRFDLTPPDAAEVMRRWNAHKSDEKWTEAELAKKLRDAEKHAGAERGRRLLERRKRLAALPRRLTVPVPLSPPAAAAGKGDE